MKVVHVIIYIYIYIYMHIYQITGFYIAISHITLTTNKYIPYTLNGMEQNQSEHAQHSKLAVAHLHGGGGGSLILM